MRRLFCLCDDRILDDIKQEACMRDEIRREIMMHRRGTGRMAVTDAALDIYEETGYDMRQHARDRILARQLAREAHVAERERAVEIRRQEQQAAREEERLRVHREAQEERQHRESLALQREMANAHIRMVSEIMGVRFEEVPEPTQSVGHHLAIEPSAEQERRRLELCPGSASAVEEQSNSDAEPEQEEEEHVECNHTARVIPRFVAAVCCALRAKFGNMVGNEANRLLIQREYLKLCRETDIRNVDAATHQQWVMNTFFNEGVMEHLATTRGRLPPWLARAFGTSQVCAPTVC